MQIRLYNHTQLMMAENRKLIIALTDTLGANIWCIVDYYYEQDGLTEYDKFECQFTKLTRTFSYNFEGFGVNGVSVYMIYNDDIYRYKFTAQTWSNIVDINVSHGVYNPVVCINNMQLISRETAPRCQALCFCGSAAAAVDSMDPDTAGCIIL